MKTTRITCDNCAKEIDLANEKDLPTGTLVSVMETRIVNSELGPEMASELRRQWMDVAGCQTNDLEKMPTKNLIALSNHAAEVLRKRREVMVLDNAKSISMGGNVQVYGCGFDRQYMDEAGKLIDDVIEECPQRILRANIFARSDQKKPPNLSVTFSHKADMTGMRQWLNKKLVDWFQIQTGKIATFAISEELTANTVRLIGQDLSDILEDKEKSTESQPESWRDKPPLLG